MKEAGVKFTEADNSDLDFKAIYPADTVYLGIMKEIRGAFEWHIYLNEIVTCFLDAQGHRTGVSYIFTFETEQGAAWAWTNVKDATILNNMAWEQEQRKEKEAAYKQYLKLKKRFENA